MSKRKAGVNDIIYELDNEDIELSSEDEGKEAKINRLEPPETNSLPQNAIDTEENSLEIVSLDYSAEGDYEIVSPNKVQNGGKTSPNIQLESCPHLSTEPKIPIEINKKPTDSKTTIFNEDIVIDSPASNSDLGVVGCENRTPLVTVRFRDKKMAKNYKEKVKAFMLSLIKLHDEESLVGSETDLELDIWPEDLVDDDIIEKNVEVEDSLFFVDTDPCENAHNEIPRYSQNTVLIDNTSAKEPTPPPVLRRGPTCFNCNGCHALRDCTMPRNSVRIAENRKAMIRVGRYHVEDDQKYGHLIPGRISGQLRHALGLKRHELPMYIYRMRQLGYPPGWLEEARISHSGITMFDSTGSAIQDPEEEEGEVSEPGSKDKFDIKKILDFPGFNVATSSRYKDEGQQYGFPPISEQDSKMSMLQMLAPNAMKAYKRKKLAFFPSASNNNSVLGPAEMELDSGDEIADFPSVPPLPDDVPPPPPPPPDSPPPELPSPPPEPSPLETEDVKTADQSADDLEVIEVMKVIDIPVPEDDLITIDDDDDKSQLSSSRNSPTLDDLEEKKRRLLDALEGDVSLLDFSISEETGLDNDKLSKKSVSSELSDKKPVTEMVVNDKQNDAVTDTETQPEVIDNEEINNKETNKNEETSSTIDIETTKTVEISTKVKDTKNDEISTASDKVTITEETSPSINKTSISNDKIQESTTDSDSDASRTPKTGRVKTTLYGTPVMNIASSYTKLPTDVKFAKDICDVINFENLPNSTGKYKQICTLLKKVKSEVDRIQES